MSFTVIIPARFASTRLPGKPLADIAGKPMIQRVVEQAGKSDAERVVVATDDARIADVVQGFGGEFCMTRADHASGTDRLQEVGQLLGLTDADIVVNVQGDEPLIPPSVINQVAKNIHDNTDASVATLCEPIERAEDFFNANIVKLVTDQAGMALYFSRAPMPWARDAFAVSKAHLPPADLFVRHIGIYAYRMSLLNAFVNWSQSPLEKLESLEQLRVLHYGHRIHVARAVEAVPGGVDTPEDLARLCQLLSQ